MIKVFTTNKDGKIELTKDELKNLLDIPPDRRAEGGDTVERLTLRGDDGRALLTPYGLRIYCSIQATADCICKLEEELNALSAFKSYFDGFYGDGLDVANFHLNGTTEPFDNFYDSAMEEYENAKRADTQRDYQAAIEMMEYCKRYEPNYNAEDGSM